MRSKQFIMEIDYPTYLESIQLYDIRQSVIPTRPNRVDPLSGLEALRRQRLRGRLVGVVAVGDRHTTQGGRGPGTQSYVDSKPKKVDVDCGRGETG